MISLMQIIREDESQDKKFRLEATRFFDKLFRYVANKQNWKKILAHKIDIGLDNPAYEIFAKDIDQKYKNLSILFVLDLHGMHGGFGVQGDKQYIALPILDEVDSMRGVPEKLLRYESTFVHEFTHFLDQQRWKGGEKDFLSFQSHGGSFRGKDPKDYYNNPMEFNAYYQQAITGYIRAVSRAMRTHQPHRVRYYIPNNIQQFVQNLERSYLRPEFVRSLSPENLRRLHKRLASLYDRMKKAKGNYERNLGDKL